MPSELKRLYFDANVLLAYVGGEEERAPTVRALLREAADGEIEILTSVLSITEVAYGAAEAAGGLSEKGEERIDQLWMPTSPIVLTDLSERTARQARSLVRAAKTTGISAPRSADALHLASAMLYKADAIFTYEAESKRTIWSQLTGIGVSEPSTDKPQLDI